MLVSEFQLTEQDAFVAALKQSIDAIEEQEPCVSSPRVSGKDQLGRRVLDPQFRPMTGRRKDTNEHIGRDTLRIAIGNGRDSGPRGRNKGVGSLCFGVVRADSRGGSRPVSRVDLQSRV